MWGHVTSPPHEAAQRGDERAGSLPLSSPPNYPPNAATRTTRKLLSK